MIYGLLIGSSILIGSIFGWFWWSLLFGLTLSLLFFSWLKYGSWVVEKNWLFWRKRVPVVVGVTKTTVKGTYFRRLGDGLVAIILVLLSFTAIALAMYWIYGGWPLWVQERFGDGGINKSVKVEKDHDWAQPLEVCDLPKGKWRYSISSTRLTDVVPGWSNGPVVHLVTSSKRGEWGMMLNGILPGGIVEITSSDCKDNRLYPDIPPFMQPDALKGAYKAGNDGIIIVTLR